MVAANRSNEERGVLRWGGLAGMLGGALFLFVFVFVSVFVGVDPAAPEGSVMRFPDIRVGRTVENGLYLVVLILWAIHFIALYHALQSTLAPALFGSAVGILGLAVLAVGALPHAASVPLSDLYHAPGATAADRAIVVGAWQATRGIFNALLVGGLVILPFGLISLGLAMLETPAFGRRLGSVSLVLGIVGVVTAVVLLVDPLSPIAAIGVFGLIAFHLILGSKLYLLANRIGSASTPA